MSPSVDLDPLSWQTDFADGRFPTSEIRWHDSTWALTGVSAHDHIFSTIASTGRFYEQTLLELLSHLVGEGTTVLDVGANIGNHTIWFAGVMGCRVRAFEPVPLLATALAHNVAQNLLDDRVIVEPFAVGDERGTAEIDAWSTANLGATALTESAGGPIPVRVLDNVDDGSSIGLIKIDVEGAEERVLDGAARLILKHRPVITAEARTDDERRAIEARLSSFGYVTIGTFNATPTLVAVPGPLTGPAGLEPFAGALDALTRRFDEFSARLDRFGRALSQSAARDADASAAGDPVAQAIIQAQRRRISDLEARVGLRGRAPGSTTIPDEGSATP